MTLKELIEKTEKLVVSINWDIKLIPKDGSDKWIMIRDNGSFYYGNAEIILKPAATPYSGTEILRINCKKLDTFLKKLSKYEDLEADEWCVDAYDFDHIITKRDKLTDWIKWYLDSTNSKILSLHYRKGDKESGII